MSALCETRVYNDLRWLIDSPQLLAVDSNSSAQSLLDRIPLPQLSQLNSHQSDLAQLKLENQFPKTYRLGVYFEQLWQYVLCFDDDFANAQHNRQVIIDKCTLGEFDSLIYDKNSSQTLHCELAVKFYLQVGEGLHLSDWVGPNLKDRFDLKYQRLFEHQLQLSRQPKVLEWLKQQQITIEQIKLLTKGRLFYPYDQFIKQQFVYPEQMNPVHDKGFWLTDTKLLKMLNNSNYQWYELPKMYWLSSITADDIANLVPINSTYLQANLMQIVAMDNENEVMRGFMVTEEWLDKAKQRVLD
ncbi:MAG: DUF1853 family protein [Kangiellaceae bacterium]|nr:DUF1853 family protein [Kangiellaceae bacterium]